tara:strand:- start:1156 stop:2790 length:1635 start_codon:yes stop_codon:yes gene_type:complete
LNQAFAQEKVLSDTFTIVKAYRPSIIEAKKIDFQPEIVDTIKLDTELKYSFINKQVPTSFQIEPIAAATIKGEPLVKLHQGYARLGIGNALLPFGEIYYTNLRSKDYAWGVHAKYFNMREVNDIEGSGRSRANFEVFGKRFWKTNTFESKISYSIDQLNYYGYYDLPSLFPTSTELPSDQLEQKYSRFKADFRLQSTKRDSFNLRHDVNMHYGMLTNNSGGTEHHIRTAANFSQFKDKELYELDVLVDHNQYDFDNENTIIAATPQISTIGKRFKVKVGLGLYLNAGEETDFHFYPLAELKYNVIKDVLVPYAGLKGEIRRVNYHSITKENPFVAEQIQLANSNEKYNLYAGVRGTLSSKISFNLSGSILKTDAAYLYIQTPDTNRLLSKDFFLTYDELDEVRLKGELIYRHNEQFKIMGQAEYFNYETNQEAEAWHRPDLKVNVSGEYNLKNKIIVRADLFYWGEQKARGLDISSISLPINTPEFTVNTLDAIFDANIGFEYRYTKRLSAFIQFNNIGGINYEKYQNYPLQGFNIWGGLTYGF